MTRKNELPYGRQSIDDDDVKAVVSVLESSRLTCGPAVPAFEEAFAKKVDTRHAVSLSNGTAALHAVMDALEITEGDEVIVPAITFAASANCVLYRNGTPKFADVDADTLLLDPESVSQLVSTRTKAIVAVDYAGQPCDYDALRSSCGGLDIPIIDDACHALGGSYREKPVGSLADVSSFSFHPVKIITTGEGGMVTTDNQAIAERVSTFRNHGIASSFDNRAKLGTHRYDMQHLGFNYRLSDIQCALGLSQLGKLDSFIAQRQKLASHYDTRLNELDYVSPLLLGPDRTHAYHLYVVRFDLENLGLERDQIFTFLRERKIGVNVHYLPVYYHQFYREQLGYAPGLCPQAEAAYERILSLPIFPDMTEDDVDYVCDTMSELPKIASN